jgi:hypothetical protein
VRLAAALRFIPLLAGVALAKKVAIAETLAANVDMLFGKAVAGTPLKSSDAG